jgi:hypothetical protein
MKTGLRLAANTSPSQVHLILGGPTRRPSLVGQRFGRLSVVYECETIKGHRHFFCQCACGDAAVVRIDTLRFGRTQSCGCLHRERMSRLNLQHGMSNTPTFSSWQSMLHRCYTPSAPDYPRYGGRGIVVCERWQESFEAFYADMGLRPPGTTLDRKDVNGNYEPENCRWATLTEQSNNKRNSRLLTFQGETLTATQWARRLGWSKGIILGRLYAGWTVEKTLTTPLRKRKPKTRRGDRFDCADADCNARATLGACDSCLSF